MNFSEMYYHNELSFGVFAKIKVHYDSSSLEKFYYDSSLSLSKSWNTTVIPQFRKFSLR